MSRQPLKSPTLLLISGPPGAGKSTLSRALARELCAAILDKDCIDEPFSPGERGPTYTREVEPRVLAALLALAEINLATGLSVLVDVPWTHILLNSPEWKTRIESLVAAQQIPLRVIELTLSETTLRSRLAARALDRDQGKLRTEAGWAAFRASDRLGEPNPFADSITIDAEQNPDHVFASSLSALRARDARP